MMPVASVEGKAVTTLEGLGTPERPDPLQAAFIAEQAAQCGYCTSGMIMQAKAILNANPRASREEVKRGLTGNLCKCGTHTRILNAIARVATAGVGRRA
jgi:nicotinate dehydrogenase subunit A